MTTEAQTAIDAAREAEPHLTSHGFGVSPDCRSVLLSGDKFDVARLEFALENVATAIAFLRAKCRKSTRRRYSYGLKHAAERWGRWNGMQPYVTNGEFIVAAVYLGYKIYREHNSINCSVGITVKE